MKEWKKVKIKDFLTERSEHYKPDDDRIAKYKRLDKIDFSGMIQISSKPTKTNMILVQPGDLVISGINVAKGALAIYQGTEPIVATIHYSSYIFDDSQIDLDYFKFFVKSPAFIEILKKQVKGGIKTEIKPKHFLPLEIFIPDLQTQKEMVKKLSANLERAEKLIEEIQKQKSYVKLLRQNILQEAIEGKLTADWRRKNPVVKGNPDFDAEALFEKIQEEKCHADSELLRNSKRNTVVEPVETTEMPFEIPASWKWVHLGEIINDIPRNGYSPKAVNFETTTKTLKLGAVTYGIFNQNEYKYIDEVIPLDSCYWLKNGDMLIERSNSIDYVGICAIYTGKDNDFIYPDLLMKFRVNKLLSNELIHKILISPYNRKYFKSKAKGAQKTMPKINQETVLNTLIPLAPISEQNYIMSILKQKISNIEQIENQITECEAYAKQLVQGILKNAFEEK